MTKRTVGQTPWHLVAEPAYLAGRRMPVSVADLAEHAVLAFSERHEGACWPLSRDGVTSKVALSPRLTSTDLTVLLDAAVHGSGIAALPAYLIDRQPPGRFVAVMPEWTYRAASLSILMPPRGQVSPAVRALGGFLADALPARVCRPSARLGSSEG